MSCRSKFISSKTRVLIFTLLACNAAACKPRKLNVKTKDARWLPHQTADATEVVTSLGNNLPQRSTDALASASFDKSINCFAVAPGTDGDQKAESVIFSFKSANGQCTTSKPLYKFDIGETIDGAAPITYKGTRIGTLTRGTEQPKLDISCADNICEKLELYFKSYSLPPVELKTCVDGLVVQLDVNTTGASCPLSTGITLALDRIDETQTRLVAGPTDVGIAIGDGSGSFKIIHLCSGPLSKNCTVQWAPNLKLEIN